MFEVAINSGLMLAGKYCDRLAMCPLTTDQIAVASIAFIGEQAGLFTWEEVCSMSAADWWRVLATSMALDEVAHGCVSVVSH